MGAWTVDDKSSDTLVVVPGEGFWTGSSTLPHLHHRISVRVGPGDANLDRRPVKIRVLMTQADVAIRAIVRAAEGARLVPEG